MPPISVIDLFAGPGGLGEGFSRAGFQSKLAIEKDPSAHKTLKFRSFFRLLADRVSLVEATRLLDSSSDFEGLLSNFPDLAERADHECWNATLGETSQQSINSRICGAIAGDESWVLIGGPPCQAYSLVGRARMRPVRDDFDQDHRHFLYREYLKIVAGFAPPVFVMENVKGLLSATVNGDRMFDRISDDLRAPRKAIRVTSKRLAGADLKYDLFAVSATPHSDSDPRRFIVRSEEFGLPQRRHRVFLVGVRSDINGAISGLKPADEVNVDQMISDLPRCFGEPTKTTQTRLECIKNYMGSSSFVELSKNDSRIGEIMSEAFRKMMDDPGSGTPVDQGCQVPQELKDWLRVKNDRVPFNHEPRKHMITDLHRYLFASSFASAYGQSPKLEQFPSDLLPKHKNVSSTGKSIFNDRFRVQVAGHSSTTVTSHISKDGHYYIHPDPSQCRSLTVREAARLQTFPDDYVFLGNRTQQYHQVGNAVPPFLAFKIAEMIQKDLF